MRKQFDVISKVVTHNQDGPNRKENIPVKFELPEKKHNKEFQHGLLR